MFADFNRFKTYIEYYVMLLLFTFSCISYSSELEVLLRCLNKTCSTLPVQSLLFFLE